MGTYQWGDAIDVRGYADTKRLGTPGLEDLLFSPCCDLLIIMNKLSGEALLPVYCQNTLVELILMISKGFYNFKTFKNRRFTLFFLHFSLSSYNWNMGMSEDYTGSWLAACNELRQDQDNLKPEINFHIYSEQHGFIPDEIQVSME